MHIVSMSIRSCFSLAYEQTGFNSLLIVLIVSFTFGCTRTEPELTQTERQIIAEKVTESMRRYMGAINAANVEEIIAHYANDSDFSVVADGQVFSYDEWVAGVQTQWAGIREASGDWDRIDVTILDADVALTLAPYHLTFTDTGGVSIPHNGIATWVWVERRGMWKMIHGHARSEPAEPH